MTEQSEDWCAGDLAVCVEYGPWFGDGVEPSVGPHIDQVLWVSIVFPSIKFPHGIEAGLEFDEFPDDIFPASAFRKVKPDADTADNAQIIALIKGARVGASA